MTTKTIEQIAYDEYEPPEFTVNEKTTVHLLDVMGDDMSVVQAAKVSVEGAAALINEPDFDPERFIGFLMKNRHGTPFEHNAFKFFVKAPIFVFREFHRHRIGFSYNEESGRYKALAGEFYAPAKDRPLTQQGKAGAYDFVLTDEQAEKWLLKRESDLRAFEAAWLEYNWQMENGIPKEMARTVLPVATFSSMFVTCNARSLMAFLSLRTKHEASMFPSFPQREIEMVAEAMEHAFASKFPVTMSAFHEHGRVSP